ncbi:MAG: PKD domain-containing protein, partial [Actinobacteria bacterium]|nr:PKD domain-containing protein [Actinomycetota bacterium]
SYTASGPFVAGVNTLDFVVHNFSGPMGLDYKAVITYAATNVISDIQLAPASQSGPVGSSQTVTATVKENNAPAAGRTVTFTAVSGPNAGVLGTAVTDSNGQASLTYSSAVAGTDTVEASFVDSTAKTQTSNRVLVEWEQTNRPPIVSAGGPYSGDEGAPVTLTGAASDPDGDALTLTWTYSPVSGVDAGATCTFSAPNSLTTTITCTDDGLYHVKLTATDSQSSASDSVAVAMLANVAPAISSVNVPVNPVALGNPVTVTAPFTDQGANDTHTWVINWDDAATSPGSGAVSASHTYASPGIYLVSVTVTDDDGGSDTETAAAYIVIYDPNAGFVTGGG